MTTNDKKIVSIKDTVRQRVIEENRKKDDDAESAAKDSLTPDFIKRCRDGGELGDGILFNALHRGKFVFAKSMDTWLVWQGHHWEIDMMDEAPAAVERVVNAYEAEIERIKKETKAISGDGEKYLERFYKTEISKFYKKINKLRTVRGVRNCLYFAHTCERPLAIHGRELDQNPWLLPVANGVVDLKTGRLQNGRPEDYMMKACPYEYHGIEAPRESWEKVLMEIFEDDYLVVEFMQRLFGAAIVGYQFEHIFPVLTGPGGRNGKGTIVETISSILGPMAEPIRSEMLLDTYQVQSSSGPTPDIMALKGLRIAFASETEERAKISAAKVKWLTGGDRLTGRAPHDKYETTFDSNHTLFLLSNFKPAADANDKAFWERMINIPFNVRFLKNREPSAENERKADLFLKEKLMAEAPGILGWLVEGCLKWQMEGLNPPPKVVQETQDYMEGEDDIQRFIDQCLVYDPGAWVGATDLYEVFETWWKRNIHNHPPKQKKFGKLIREKGYVKEKSGCLFYRDIRVRDEWQGPL